MEGTLTTTISGKEVPYRLVELPQDAKESMKRVEIVKFQGVSADGQRARFLVKDNFGPCFLITNVVAAKYLQRQTGRSVKMMRADKGRYSVNIVF